MPATVARLSIAPVKALGLVHPEEVVLGPAGVAGDRRFLLFDAGGRLYNGKRRGSLVTVRPRWDEATRELVLRFPDGREVGGTVELGDPVDAVLYGDPHPARRVLGPWQAALSAFAGEELSLLWSESHATDRGAIGGTVSLISRGSLDRLAEEASAPGPVDGRRFRMLLEIDGVAPNAEDRWLGEVVRAGEAAIRVLGEIGRCVVTSHDPDRGVTDLDTLGALARYRRRTGDEALPLGVSASVVEPGRVRVGDGVQAPGGERGR